MAQTGALTKSSDGQYSSSFADGQKPIISGFTGSFGGNVILSGNFSAERSAPFNFIRGNPALIGQNAIGNIYKHSLIDSYNGNGACLHAKKNKGTTVVGDLVSGSNHAVTLPAPAKSCYVTGMIKIVTQDYSDPDSGPQLKTLRIRNLLEQALSFQIPQWTFISPTQINTMTYFVFCRGFFGPDGNGGSAAGLQLFSGEWVRFVMYYKPSSASGVADGAAQMLQKSQSGYYYSFRENGDGDRMVNDFRASVANPRVRVSDKCMDTTDRLGEVTDHRPNDVEFCFYGMPNQQHDIMYDDIWINETPEAVWLCSHPTLDQSWLSGKVHLAPYQNATETQIQIDTSSASVFAASDNVYVIRVNANGAESDAILLRAAT